MFITPIYTGSDAMGQQAYPSESDMTNIVAEQINPRTVSQNDFVNGSFSSPGLDELRQKADADPEHYSDSYLNAILERENTLQAQDYYKRMADTQYSRAMEDIKKAGFNPYLALQGLSGAGSGSVSAAGVQAVNGSQLKLDEKSANSQMWRAIAAIAGIAVTIAMMA